jgi:octaprenyl-diphosphate synthase
VLAAFHAGTPGERAFWFRTIEQSEQTDADLEEALTLMERRGALQTTFARARRFATLAQDALAPFPPSALRTCLHDVADFTVSRVA